ncbi:CDP-glucose 4,6-dehydratase [Polynucleobacter paneuropaeus]|nr:CDP-glucose 4,6-dehydratase [Polynucleobacter paneuropaeus]
MSKPFSTFWRGKRVLLTGHTGFKGAWLSLWLDQMGAEVFGVSLPPSGHPNLFELLEGARFVDSNFLDIRDYEALTELVKGIRPEVVFHMAAQSLVRPSYDYPLETLSTNIMGTANILNSLRGLDSVKSLVVVTTDKVYKNLERAVPYCENDILGGYDPYSASKAASEIIISSFKDSFLFEQGVGVASARAGNVIGGGDWSAYRLIPDAVRAWQSGLPICIRSPHSVRPWQHVLEPLNGYLKLAEQLYTNRVFSGAYNFGPQPQGMVSVKTVIELASREYGSGSVIWGGEEGGVHEAGLLYLDVSKAKQVLGVSPSWNLEKAISQTMKWYLRQQSGDIVRSICLDDIAEYLKSPCGGV